MALRPDDDRRSASVSRISRNTPLTLRSSAITLNSAALPTTESPTEELLNNVRRIYRRICLLRATGRHSEALDLEIDEFSRVLAASHDAGIAEPHTSAAMSEEAARVTQAATLAELLAPLLAEKLRASPAPAAAATPATSSSPAPVFQSASERPASAATPSLSPTPAPASGTPSVTDLLDGMFALESPHRASRAAR